MSRRILILGASRYYQSTIAHLKSLGYETFVVDKQPHSPGFEIADHSSVIDFSNAELTLQFAEKHQINGIMPLNDYGVSTAAFINFKLGLTGVSPTVATCVSDKSKMRTKWRSAKLLNPKFFVANTVAEACRGIQIFNLTYPLIIKPTDSRGGGSRGVKVIEAPREITEAVKFAQSFYENKNFIIEECVKGTEHSLEVVISDGKIFILGASIKSKLPYPYRVDKQVIYPASLTTLQQQKIYTTIQRAIAALGLTNGVAHVELAMPDNDPVLFEVGLRPGGGATPFIIHKVFGIDYLDLYAQVISGKKIESVSQSIDEKAGIYHFFSFPEGLTCKKKLDNIENFCFREYIQDIEIFTKPGEKTTSIRTGPDRHGFAVIVGSNLNQVENIAKVLDEFIQENFYE